METLNRKSTNAEILAVKEIATALKTGNPVVISISETRNEEIFQLNIVQQLKIESNDGVDAANELFMGWGKVLVRCIRSVTQEQFDTVEGVAELCEPGAILEGMNIQVIDSLEPQYDGHKPRMRKNKEGVEFVLCLGDKPVYRDSELVVGESESTIISKTVSVPLKSVTTPFSAIAGKDESNDDEEEVVNKVNSRRRERQGSAA
jgi:hypothetical protein